MAIHINESNESMNAYQAFLLRLDTTYLLEKVDYYHRKAQTVYSLLNKFNLLRRQAGQAALEMNAVLFSEGPKAHFESFLNKTPPVDDSKCVQYLDERSVASYRVQFINGKACNVEGQPLDSSAFKGKSPGFGAFVIDKKGQFYFNKHIKSKFHHSSFTSGDDVLCAGMIKIKSGKVEIVNNDSGHYKPDGIHLALAFHLLNNKGVFGDKNHYASKNRFVAGVLAFLAVLRIYTPSPKVKVYSRSSVILNVAHVFQQTRFKPLYWLGRLLDAYKVTHSYSLQDYDKFTDIQARQNTGFSQAIDVINKANNIVDTRRKPASTRSSVNSASFFRRSGKSMTATPELVISPVSLKCA